MNFTLESEPENIAEYISLNKTTEGGRKFTFNDLDLFCHNRLQVYPRLKMAVIKNAGSLKDLESDMYTVVFKYEKGNMNSV